MKGLPFRQGKVFAEMEDALRSRRTRVVHLTHNDLDAAGADAIHRMKHGEVFTLFSSVGNFVNLLSAVAESEGRGDLLSISDLGYQHGADRLLRKARSRGWKVEWRDHHRWQEGEKEAIREVADLLHVDTERCACGIVAGDLLPDDPRATDVARVVCDYDLWKNQDPRSAILGRVLSQNRNRDYIRDRLSEGVILDDHIREEYRKIEEEMRGMIERSVARTRFLGIRYRIAFAPLYGYPNETAAEIRRRLGSEIEVVVSPSGKFSLRSVPPVSHLVARHFGGGGHPHASGGVFPFTLVDRIRFFLLGETPHFHRLARVADSLE
ncbi:MAG: phosphoesterase [Methanomicrobiales archaeon]|nr:phosphoesterase [Methanomicrobiales archaeon]